MDRKRAATVWLGVFLAFVAPAAARADGLAADLESILRFAAPDDELAIIVTHADRLDVARFGPGGLGRERSDMVRALRANAQRTLPPIEASLRASGARDVNRLWLINGVAAVVPTRAISALRNLPGVDGIRLDQAVAEPVVAPAAFAMPQWNIDAVRAPELWLQGVRGQGIVVATLDTGVDAIHADLRDRWRGGANSWFDPHGEHAEPYDASGHGTSVMGLLVGGEAGGTAIGMAPDARWIAVKIFNDAGLASLSAIHRGFQWLLDPDGDPLTDDAPAVVNNSWGIYGSGACDTEFELDVQTLKAAGIAVVFAAGNDGPFSSTSTSPANYPDSFAAGSIDATLQVALSSSRGPAACDGGTYPQIVAPGIDVTTADLTFGGLYPNAYIRVNGTSFAAPHVAGAMALLRGAFPGLEVAQMEAVLERSAFDLGVVGPDNDAGFGLLDVAQAYALLRTDGDGDGFAAGDDCDDGDPTVHPGAREAKHDGIDQDCNGYDLTIDVLRAVYDAGRNRLQVEAISELRELAGLTLDGYGAMSWKFNKDRWTITATAVAMDPGFVTITGVEGSESAPTTPRAKGRPARR